MSDTILERIKEASDVVVRVGLPSVVLLVIVAVSTSIIMGWTPSPFVSAKDFANYIVITDVMHQALLKQTNTNTEALKTMTETMQAMNCDNKKSDVEKLRCFRRMNGSDN